MEKKKSNSTILFFDLRGWYKKTQGKEASQIASELDSFYKEVIDQAGTHNGRVVKFMGDAALVMFEDASNAVEFARSLTKKHEASVGIEAGEVISGNFGKDNCQWFDVIGQPVNEAAINMNRANKLEKGTRIVLGPTAWEALDDEARVDLTKS